MTYNLKGPDGDILQKLIAYGFWVNVDYHTIFDAYKTKQGNARITRITLDHLLLAGIITAPKGYMIPDADHAAFYLGTETDTPDLYRSQLLKMLDKKTAPKQYQSFVQNTCAYPFVEKHFPKVREKHRHCAAFLLSYLDMAQKIMPPYTQSFDTHTLPELTLPQSMQTDLQKNLPSLYDNIQALQEIRRQKDRDLFFPIPLLSPHTVILGKDGYKTSVANHIPIA